MFFLPTRFAPSVMSWFMWRVLNSTLILASYARGSLEKVVPC